MNYAQEKKILQTKKRKLKIAGVIVGVVLLAIFAMLGGVYAITSWKYKVGKPKLSARGEGEMRMHFIDVGQGDCTILELPDGKIALIDCGNGTVDSNKAVLRYLNALKVDEIDYLIVTHADSDHAGGASEILKYKQVKRVFLPLATPNNYEYDLLLAAVLQSGTAYSMVCPPDPSRVETFMSVTDGEYPYTLAFLYPTTEMVDNGFDELKDNELSAVVWLDYQGVSTLFTGDAPTQTENKLILDDTLGLFELYGVTLSQTEILKVSHHGSDDATSQLLLDYLHAQTAIISCGENNEYSHPDEAVLKRLTDAGVDVYRTDKQGTIVIAVSNTGEYQAFSPN